MEGLGDGFRSSNSRASRAAYPLDLVELELAFEAQQNDGFSPNTPRYHKLVDEERFDVIDSEARSLRCAGSYPTGEVHPIAVAVLREHGASKPRSESRDEFAAPGAPDWPVHQSPA